MGADQMLNRAHSSELEKTLSAGAHEHHYTTLGVDNRKLGMWLLIASECMLFGTLIVTYMIYRTKSVVGPHPTVV